MSDSDMFYCSFVSIHYIICECGETFPTEEELKTHLEIDHAVKKERKEYKCGVCETVFCTEEECIMHYESSHIEIKEEHDYVEAEEAEEVEEHEDVEETVEMEEDSGETTEIIYEHVVKDEGEEVEEEEDEEERDIKPPPLIKTRSKKERKPKSYYNIKNIVCEVCGKRYASNAALRYHQRVHTGERPYKCTECSKSFTMPLFLQIHLRTHTGERPYECSLCPKAFSNKAALLRHDRVHTGIKPYECPQCGKFFTQSNSMKLHVNTVHLKMPAPYKSKTRRNKAKEREMLREAILRVIDNEDNTAVETINQTEAIEGGELRFVKTEDDVEESQVLYEDVDSREITYEVVYEE
ncbi:unnamed protein product [Chrysodeixis includens]|uniref:C2H2-type domain-containing protein n=1 Tax=Chrysodeixis includens TaxID=689277 RepID=A0A9P0FZE9_CHRIL|nr:unnamed protein product [Chrysodeixis includens]